MVDNYLRTIDLANAVHLSVQQVRNYEAGGFLPPAQRSTGGYRLYTEKHLKALKTTRTLLVGYGWQATREIMQAVHEGNLAAALTRLDEQHAELAAKRLQLQQLLTTLKTLAVQLTQTAPANSRQPTPLRVGEAAQLVGVRVSAVHFWEQQGLLQPTRDSSSRYRLYDEQQIRRLQIVALLREAGYDFEAIHLTLNELASGQPAKAIAAVEKRHSQLARKSWDCLAAATSFQAYIEEFWPELSGAL